MRTAMTFVAVLFVSFSGEVTAQDMEAANADVVEVTVRSLESLQSKVLAMAEDFPQELFGYRPHPDSRSFAEEIWHIALGTHVLSAQITGAPLTPEIISTPNGAEHDRAMMVQYLTSGTSRAAGLLRERFHPRSISSLEHMAEHYGKLVTIYRVNGLVPPASR